MSGKNQQPRRRQSNRGQVAVVGILFAFVVWTTFRPVRPDGWSAASLPGAHPMAGIPMPALLMVFAGVLVLWRMSRSGGDGL